MDPSPEPPTKVEQVKKQRADTVVLYYGGSNNCLVGNAKLSQTDEFVSQRGESGIRISARATELSAEKGLILIVFRSLKPSGEVNPVDLGVELHHAYVLEGPKPGLTLHRRGLTLNPGTKLVAVDSFDSATTDAEITKKFGVYIIGLPENLQNMKIAYELGKESRWLDLPRIDAYGRLRHSALRSRDGTVRIVGIPQLTSAGNDVVEPDNQEGGSRGSIPSGEQEKTAQEKAAPATVEEIVSIPEKTIDIEVAYQAAVEKDDPLLVYFWAHVLVQKGEPFLVKRLEAASRINQEELRALQKKVALLLAEEE